MKRHYTHLRILPLIVLLAASCHEAKSQCVVDYTTSNYFCDLDSLWLTAVPVEGTGPFSFLWETGETTQTILIPLAYGDYMVTMTDATGCTHIINCHVKPYPEVLYYPYNQNACEDDTVTLFLEWFRDSLPGALYEWSTGETTSTIQLTDDLVWSVTVTDPATGCEFIIPPNLFDFHETPKPEIVGPTEICDGQSITLTVEGGAFGNLVWYINGTWEGIWAPELTLTEPATVIVWASSPTADYCWNQDTIDVVLGEITPPQIIGPPDLCEFQGGLVEVTNAGLYESFIWSNGETGSSFTATEPGTYTVTVTEEGGCTSSESIVIEDAPENELFIDATSASCGLNNGSIDLSYSLSGSYDFLWSTGATTQNIDNIPAGIYSVTVTDPEGCSATIEAEVQDDPVDIVINDIITHNTSCEAYNGAIDISVLPNTEVYTFIWSNGATTEDLTDLFPGVYTVTVTTGNTCTATADFLVDDFSAAPDIFSTVNPATCGEENGSVELTLVGGSEPFIFMWSNGEESQSIFNLPPGDYGVTVTAADGCVGFEYVEVPDVNPPIQIDAITEPNTSCNASNGGIDITVTPPDAYDYSWSTGATSEDLFGLGEGEYIVTVSLGASCQEVDTFYIINESLPFEINGATANNSSCIDPNGSIDLTITPAGTYTYEWSDGSTDEDLEDLNGGNYTVTVTNSDGCAVTSSFNISDVSSSITISGISINNTSCNVPNGQIDISVTPAGAYSFQWSNGSITEDLSNIPPGTYTVTVSDGNGCTADTTFNITDQNNSLTLSAAMTDNTSCTVANGSLDLTVTPSGTYTFAWSNGSSTEDLSGVQGGTYTVTVSDANGCNATGQFIIQSNTQDPVLSGIISDETCSMSNGAVDLTSTPAGNSFLWSTGAVTEDLIAVSAGSYSVTVTSINGCSAIDTFNVANTSNNFSISGNATDNSSCVSANGIIDLNITPAGTYSFLWSNGSFTEDLQNLNPGTYGVTVTDHQNCSSSAVFTILDNSTNPTISELITPSSCGIPNGGIQITMSPAGIYSYQWSDGSNSKDLSGVLAGSYSVTVTNQEGCTSTATFNIPDNNSNFVLGANITNNSSCQNPNGSIDLQVTPTGLYDFQWSNSAITEDLSGVPAGTYIVTVTDEFNCPSTLSLVISDDIESPILSPLVSPASCGQSNGSIDLTIDQTSNNLFLWSNGSTLEDLANIPPGTYQVTVTGDNGCTAAMSIDVPNQNSNFTISSDIIHDVSCTLDAGSIDLHVLPAGSYLYNWSNGLTAEDLLDIKPGIYSVTVTDQLNCSTSASYEVEDHTTLPFVEEIIKSATCGSDNARIDITVSPATGVNFLWSTGATIEDLDNIAAGEYSVTVTDANGCSIERDYLVPGSTLPEILLEANLNAGQVGDEVICSLSVNVPVNSLQSIQWLPDEIMNCHEPLCFEQIFTLLEQTEVQVMVMDTDGCMVTANLMLLVEAEVDIYIPNVFNPESNSPNSKFTIFGNDQLEEIVELEIFDRWGNKVFVNESFPPNEPDYGWDGMFGGQMMNPAVFAYRAIVRYANGEFHSFKGDVTLVR